MLNHWPPLRSAVWVASAVRWNHSHRADFSVTGPSVTVLLCATVSCLDHAESQLCRAGCCSEGVTGKVKLRLDHTRAHTHLDDGAEQLPLYPCQLSGSGTMGTF